MTTAGIFVTLAAVAAGYLNAQTPASTVSLIASVKPNNDVNPRAVLDTLPGGRVTGSAVTVNALLRAAYHAQPRDIVGAPAWFGTKRYDITAKAEGNPAPSGESILRELLKERFGLEVHREKREQPTYSLVLARSDGKLGPKLTASSFDCVAYRAMSHSPEPGSVPQCGARVNPSTVSARAVSMAELATFLVPGARRRVVDKTGLAGLYDIELSWTPDGPAAAPDARPDDSGPPPIFTAVQEQLGLKLVGDKALVEVLVVDHASEPSEN